ncbi:LysM peptidoglycan-binding domain-containing protein [Luteolibacter flavescens]|uniref:LysM peptidoglycan-binding domain-containing protein n=1 Tax=Luteolibacter flavescens TaxID=1859460 RepID=A0ABT3FHY9_9BACT|nr:LysM peptidoglycan-binding domain-containing protein [Luteolibacter flavescens]MCW1883170.1 LysM peptidoglycan-binding domain-containing protein [Luteolibacter flavescens]
MRTASFLAALLCTAPLANAKSELELLQNRCAEMERQIRALETENSQLKSQASVSTKTVVETAKPVTVSTTKPKTSTTAPAKTATAAATSPSSSSFATVRPGDTLEKVAKRNGTTSATLVKLNKLKNPSLIQPGQKLLLPDKAPAAVAKKTAPAAPSTSTPAPTPAPRGGTHIVKAGETFYSIARHYGMSSDALQAGNPHIKADKMRAGQTLNLGGSKPAQKTTATAKAKTSPSPAPATASTKAPAVTNTASREPAPAPQPTTETVGNNPKLRLIVINEPIGFGDFAAAHGTTTAKLNALNGHSLNPSTVLAKESEFYVPAQP